MNSDSKLAAKENLERLQQLKSELQLLVDDVGKRIANCGPNRPYVDWESLSAATRKLLKTIES